MPGAGNHHGLWKEYKRRIMPVPFCISSGARSGSFITTLRSNPPENIPSRPAITIAFASLSAEHGDHPSFDLKSISQCESGVEDVGCEVSRDQRGVRVEHVVDRIADVKDGLSGLRCRVDFIHSGIRRAEESHR